MAFGWGGHIILGLAASPLPQLSWIFVVKESWQLTVSRATHYAVYQTLPGRPDENQETGSKNLNLSCGCELTLSLPPLRFLSLQSFQNEVLF